MRRPTSAGSMPPHKDTAQKQEIPAQHQDDPTGRTREMHPQPKDKAEGYKGSGKLDGKVALVTGADSGIGRSVAIHFAKEGADVAIVYLNHDDEAEVTKRHVEQAGRRCLTLKGDVGKEAFCRDAVSRVAEDLGRLDVLVNNAGIQQEQRSLEDITEEQLTRTFRTNIFGQFFVTKAALPHLHEGSSIINTSSITGLRGQPLLIDYSATKGAILAFTFSLAQNLADKKIRVNAVAPGETWTPLIPSGFSAEKVQGFGKDQPLGGPAQPDDLAPAFVFLASSDSRFITGEVLGVFGGERVGV